MTRSEIELKRVHFENCASVLNFGHVCDCQATADRDALQAKLDAMEKELAEYRVRPFVEIELTQGLVALVDRSDAEWIRRFNWQASKGKWTTYASRFENNGKRTSVQMHREIMKPPEGMEVDHINGDGLDNRRANLRVCTDAENSQNRRKRPLDGKATSRYIGVSMPRASKKWYAKIKTGGRSFHIGMFDTEIEAARAYDKRAFELRGEFARLNFPMEVSL